LVIPDCVARVRDTGTQEPAYQAQKSPILDLPRHAGHQNVVVDSVGGHPLASTL